MKYSEFEKRITERLGFKVKHTNRNVAVVAHSGIGGYVAKEAEYNFAVRSDERLTHDEARFLAHQCHELACTPLEEREDEKKYRIRLKGVAEPLSYLSVAKDGGEYFFSHSHKSHDSKNVFTETDISTDYINMDLIHLINYHCDWEVVE